MKFWLLSVSLAASTAIANNDLDGYFEVGKYFNTNRGAYIDSSGNPKDFYLDMEIRQYFLDRTFNFMLGFDSNTNGQQFARGAGRVGAEVSIDVFDVGFWHRSDHNFDHSMGSFYSENRVYLRWNFSGRGR